jgi:hypothetical protein
MVWNAVKLRVTVGVDFSSSVTPSTGLVIHSLCMSDVRCVGGYDTWVAALAIGCR